MPFSNLAPELLCVVIVDWKLQRFDPVLYSIAGLGALYSG